MPAGENDSPPDIYAEARLTQPQTTPGHQVLMLIFQLDISATGGENCRVLDISTKSAIGTSFQRLLVDRSGFPGLSNAIQKASIILKC